MIKVDKLSSTDAGQFPDAVEVVNRPHIIIRKIEIDRNSNNEFESELDTPISGQGIMSSQRSVAHSRGSVLSKEYAKGHNSSQVGSRSPKKLGKSVLYTNPTIGSNPTQLLDNFVKPFNTGSYLQRNPY